MKRATPLLVALWVACVPEPSFMRPPPQPRGRTLKMLEQIAQDSIPPPFSERGDRELLLSFANHGADYIISPELQRYILAMMYDQDRLDKLGEERYLLSSSLEYGKDSFGRSFPVLRISHKESDGTWVPVNFVISCSPDRKLRAWDAGDTLLIENWGSKDIIPDVTLYTEMEIHQQR